MNFAKLNEVLDNNSIKDLKKYLLKKLNDFIKKLTDSNQDHSNTELIGNLNYFADRINLFDFNSKNLFFLRRSINYYFQSLLKKFSNNKIYFNEFKDFAKYVDNIWPEVGIASDMIVQNLKSKNFKLNTSAYVVKQVNELLMKIHDLYRPGSQIGIEAKINLRDLIDLFYNLNSFSDKSIKLYKNKILKFLNTNLEFIKRDSLKDRNYENKNFEILYDEIMAVLNQLHYIQ